MLGNNAPLPLNDAASDATELLRIARGNRASMSMLACPEVLATLARIAQAGGGGGRARQRPAGEMMGSIGENFRNAAAAAIAQKKIAAQKTAARARQKISGHKRAFHQSKLLGGGFAERGEPT
jgi:hypothetical protein